MYFYQYFQDMHKTRETLTRGEMKTGVLLFCSCSHKKVCPRRKVSSSVLKSLSNIRISVFCNMALAHPRMARQGEVISLMGDLNAYESSTNKQTSVFKGTFISCRARESNPGPQ